MGWDEPAKEEPNRIGYINYLKDEIYRLRSQANRVDLLGSEDLPVTN